MMVRIQRSFGVKLPLAAVFRQSTLGGLAALIDERPQHDASIVVPIQTKGERTPLFCVHPAGGHVLCYSELARDLGAARPFYGLQVREGNGVEPYADLVTMASDYLEAIQKIQARGPYLLAGWSMGAVVAHNVACQLESHGETVATLVLLDPPELDSGSARSAASLEAFAKQFGVSLARSDSNLVTETLEDILRQGQRDGTVSSHMNATSFQSLYDIFQNNIRILNAFTPKPSRGHATLFQPVSSPRPMKSVRTWRALVAGLEVQRVPGDHFSMIRGADGKVLAGQLRPLLDAADPRVTLRRMVRRGVNPSRNS